MIQKPTNWDNLINEPNRTFETCIVVGEEGANATVIGAENILAVPYGTESLMGDTLDCGKVCIQEKTFSFKGVPQGTINRGDRLAVWKRVAKGTSKSGWLPCGVYYARKPQYQTQTDFNGNQVVITTFDGYDEMPKLNYVPFGESTIEDWNNKTSREVASLISDYIDLDLESTSQVPTTIIPAPPYGYTAREIFEDIATSVCGNWMLTYVADTTVSYLKQTPKLRLVRWANPNTTTYYNVGVNAQAVAKGDELGGVDCVVINYGTNDNGATLYKQYPTNYTGSGRILEKTVSIYTDGDIVQAMAQSIYNAQHSVSYQPLTCTKARFDIAYELGDTVKVKNDYFIITKREISSDQAQYTSLQAVDKQAEEDSYKWGNNRASQDLKRDNATTKAQIKVTANEIRQSVTGSKATQYSSIHTYAQGDFVYEGNTYYKSLQNNNTGHALTNTSWWQVTSAAEIIEAGLDISLDGLQLYYKGSGASATLALKKSGVEIAGSAVTVIADATHITGQLVANQIAANAITLGKLGTDVTNVINGAVTTANSAKSIADDVDAIVTGWTYGSTTYIDGEKLMTGTVTASTIQGGTISLLNAAMGTAGALTLTSASSGNYAVDLASGAALRLKANNGAVFIQNTISGNSATVELYGTYVAITPRLKLGSASYGTAEPSGTPPGGNGSLYFKYS